MSFKIGCASAMIGLIAACSLPSQAQYKSAVKLADLADRRIAESSGLATSRVYPSSSAGVLWTHNDSGNDALIYAMSTEGKHLGTWRVDGAQNVDWESVATNKDPGGKCFLLLGDIGDNDETRGEVEIYRIPEPTETFRVTISDGR